MEMAQLAEYLRRVSNIFSFPFIPLPSQIIEVKIHHRNIHTKILAIIFEET
jgi:hypothetical protein